MSENLAHWRDSARRPRFFVVDAAIIWPLCLFIFNIGRTTGALFILSLLILLLMERFNFTVLKAYRYFFVLMVGPIRYRKGWWQ